MYTNGNLFALNFQVPVGANSPPTHTAAEAWRIAAALGIERLRVVQRAAPQLLHLLDEGARLPRRWAADGATKRSCIGATVAASPHALVQAPVAHGCVAPAHRWYRRYAATPAGACPSHACRCSHERSVYPLIGLCPLEWAFARCNVNMS